MRMVPKIVYKKKLLFFLFVPKKTRLMSLPALNWEDHVSQLAGLCSLSFLEYSANFPLGSLAFGPAKGRLFCELFRLFAFRAVLNLSFVSFLSQFWAWAFPRLSLCLNSMGKFLWAPYYLCSQGQGHVFYLFLGPSRGFLPVFVCHFLS